MKLKYSKSINQMLLTFTSLLRRDSRSQGPKVDVLHRKTNEMYHPIFPRTLSEKSLSTRKRQKPASYDGTLPDPFLHVQQRSYISRPVLLYSDSDIHTHFSPQDFNTCCKTSLQEGQGRLESQNGYGRCGADQICVGSTPREQNGLFQTYCISTDHFVDIVSTLSSDVVLDYCLILIDSEALLVEQPLVLTIVRCCESLGRISHITPRPALDPVSIFCYSLSIGKPDADGIPLPRSTFRGETRSIISPQSKCYF